MATVRIQGADRLTRSADWENGNAVTTAKATLFTARAYNKGAASFFLQIHDSATAPTDQSTLIGVYECYAGSYIGDEFGSGLPITNGIYLLAATTQTGVTAIASSDAFFNCGWTAR